MSSLTLDAGVVPLPRPSRGGLVRPAGRTAGRSPDRVGDRAGDRVGDRAADRAGDRAEVLKALVLRARDGDAEAFGSLYDHYVELVYRYIYYRVGTHSLTEDLTSETFLRALRRICDFHWQGKDFGAWLVTIARNLVADHFKSGRYRLEVCTAEPAEPEHHQEGPERAVLDAMTNRTLLLAVRQLGSEQQECVVLRFLHGLTVAETALIMDKKPGAIKALQYRAVRSLARMLPADLRG